MASSASLADAAPVDTSGHKTCSHCNLRFDPKDGRVHGAKFVCHTCGNVSRQLRRNLGDLSSIQEFSTEETHAFYQQVHKEREKCQDKQLSWQVVKATLVTSMTTRQTSLFSQKVSGEWLPLSVWVSKGWKKATVEQQPKEWSDEFNEDVYWLATKKLTWKEITEKIQERLLQQEQQATQRRRNGRGDGSAVMAVPKALPKGNKVGQEADTPGEASNPKEARRQEASVAKHNKCQQALAAKSLGLITSMGDTVARLAAKAEPLQDDASKLFKLALAPVKEKCVEWKKAMHETLRGAEALQSMETPTSLQSLPFDWGQVKALSKDVAKLNKDSKSLGPARPAPKKRARAPAEASAAPQGPPAKESRRRCSTKQPEQK